MTTALLIATVVLLLVVLGVLVLLLKRQPPNLSTFETRMLGIEQALDRTERAARDEAGRAREDAAGHARNLREELSGALKAGLDSVLKGSTEAATQQAAKLDGFAGQLSQTNEVSRTNGRELREDVTKAVQEFANAAMAQIKEAGASQKERLDEFASRLGTLADGVAKRLDEMSSALDARLEANQKAQAEAASSAAETLHKQLRELQEDNGKQITQMRTDAGEGAKRSRDEITKALEEFKASVVQEVSAASKLQKSQLESFATQLTSVASTTETKLGEVRETVEKRLALLHEGNDKKLAEIREESRTAGQAVRGEITTALKEFQQSVMDRLGTHAAAQKTLLDGVQGQIAKLTETNAQRLEELRGVVDLKLKELREENSQKLDQMRQTVDEKLEGTLEKRLGESFKLVSDRLEQVHKGLGEMQTLASGVGDLKRVLTNVKARGTWAEVQLGALLEQTLAPEQFAKNVATKPDSAERVEFAIKLPGRDGNMESPVWLPLDAKCPQEDYIRLVEAAEAGDPDAVREASKALEHRVRCCARDICEKYLSPPHTTDFGILFLPTEGLYAEVLRCPGLTDGLQRECRVIVAGPTTLFAILNSLQMGFRTLAIEKRSSEVWAVLGAVKTEFGKFGSVFQKVKKKLAEASKTVDDAGVRTRAMERKLRTVDELTAPDAAGILGLKLPPVEEAAAAGTPALNGDAHDAGTGA